MEKQFYDRLGIRKAGLTIASSKPAGCASVKIGARAVGIIEELDALIEELRRERDRRP